MNWRKKGTIAACQVTFFAVQLLCVAVAVAVMNSDLADAVMLALLAALHCRGVRNGQMVARPQDSSRVAR
jgi:hypothetical protein